MLFRRTLEGFGPADTEAGEWHYKTKLGALVEMKCKRPRSPMHHRKFFALLNLVVQNSEVFDTVEQMRVALMAALCRGKWIEIPGASKALFIPESISFKSMSQDEFNIFYNECINNIIKFWLPANCKDIEDQLALAIG